jgi:alcohol dehydrogenase class IV
MPLGGMFENRTRLMEVFQVEPVTFQIPTKIIYGVEASKRLGDLARQLGISRALVVADKGIVQSHLLDQLLPSLEAAQISFALFEHVEPNPRLETIDAATEFCLKEECDGVVAVGGGSPLDTGKAVGVLATNPGGVRTYIGVGKIKKVGIPVIAVPTTAGTAAEITDVAVLSDHEEQIKATIRSPQVAPQVALLDPLLTLSMPPSVTRDTGMDALTHAVESFISINAWDASEALCLKAIELIGSNLRTAVYNGSNLAAREAMLSASLLAGMAFHNTKLCLVHAITGPLGGMTDMPHGVSNAIVLPHALEFLLPGALDKYAQIAAALGEPVAGLSRHEAAQRAVNAVRQLMDDIGVPCGLSAYKADPGIFPVVAEKAAASFMIPLSPRRASPADIVGILQRAY